MSGNSGSYLFSYNSKNTLNRIILDSNRKRREGLENGSASPAQPKSHLTPKRSAASSLLGRRTPLQTRPFQSNICPDVDEVQQQITSSPMASVNDAYMRQDESILVSPGDRNGLQAGRHITDQFFASPSTESFGMIFDDCMAQLRNWNGQLKDKYAETSRDLSNLRQKYEEISTRLVTAETDLKESRQVATSALVEIKAKEVEKKLSDNVCAETKAQVAALVQENDLLKSELASVKVEAGRLKAGLDSYKKRLAQFSESLAALGSGLRELGQAHNSSREQLQLVRMEFEDTKRKATNGLEALQPILDDDGPVARVQEMKALLNDLQESLVSSHQVTDILRSKNLHQASQLADAQARVKALEEQSLAKLFATAEDNKQHIALLVDMGRNVEEVTAKLITREKEALNALVASASLEANLEVLSKEIDTYKASCGTHAMEREENISKLLSLQTAINTRDKEISALKADLRGLKESKEDLRALLAEAKKNLAEKELEIRARDPNIAFQLKIEDLTEEVGSLKIRLQEAGEKQKSSLDDWLSQENALKKRLYEAEGVNIASRVSNEQLQASVLRIQAELATLVVEHQRRHEELRTAADDVSKLQGRLDTQGVELSLSKEEYNKLNLQYRKSEARMEEKDRLLQVQEGRASVAEGTVTWAKEQLAAANLKSEKLEACIAAFSRDTSLAKEAAEQAVSSVKNESRAQLTILQQKILQLESVNAHSNGRAERLIESYRTGKLTDAEKLFVSHIISETEAVQEERTIRKDNELRLREISLEQVNSKLETAQETIRRLLAEKNGKGTSGDKSMVDLGVISSEANKQPVGLTSDSMADDSEDDIPLAQLQNEELDVKQHGIKRSRSPSPVLLQAELQKRSKQKAPPEAVTKKNKGKKKR